MTVENEDIAQINIDNISIAQAKKVVKDIFNKLPEQEKINFRNEWGKQVATVHESCSSSVRAASAADVIMIEYAQRFLRDYL